MSNSRQNIAQVGLQLEFAFRIRLFELIGRLEVPQFLVM